MRALLTCMAIVPVALTAMLAGCQEPGGNEYTYTLSEGDSSFAAVSQKVYGDAKYADDIAAANPDMSEDQLKPGMMIDIPEMMDESGKPMVPKTCDRKKVY